MTKEASEDLAEGLHLREGIGLTEAATHQLIAQLDDLCHCYLDFCDDHLVGGGNPIQADVDCSDHCQGLEWPS